MKWCLWVFVSLAFVVWEVKGQSCVDQVNVAFVLDGSSGLNSFEFDTISNLVIQYVRGKKVSQNSNIHAGLIVVSGNVYARQAITADIDQFSRYVSNVQFQAGAGIELGTAIEVAFSDLVTHPSLASKRNVMIVLTSQQSLQPSRTRVNADFARDIGIDVFAIGLKNAPTQELQVIAGGSDKVYRVQNILAAATLPDIRLNLDGVDCGGVTPSPTTQRPTTARPTTPSPTTLRPITPSPTTPRPTTPRPTTARPTTRPTTPSPTTRRPTTPSPTTQRPTTPTTRRPTTPSPTTRRPTTPRTTPRRTTPQTTRPTTARTTSRPTTVRTTFRPLPTESLCQDARIIGTVGYRGHPTQPENYIQCYYPQANNRRRKRDTSPSVSLMATNTVAIIRQCPYGLFWNQGTRTCELFSLTSTSGDACSQEGHLTRGVNGNCRAYFRCSNGRSVPSCCPAGYAYSPLKCIPCPNCRDTCMMAQAREFACNRYPAWDDVYSFLAYKWDRDGGSYVKQSCPNTCYFNLPSCDCSSRPWITQNDTVIPCGAKIDIPIFFASSNEYRLEDVVLQGGVAVLNGDSSFIHINLENDRDFANYSGPLAIELRYMEVQEITTRHALMSSPSCENAGYILATIDRESILVEVTTEIGTLTSLEVPTVGFKPGEWKTVRLVDSKEFISLSVSNGKDAYVSRARASSRRYVECGLDIGKAEFVDSLNGMIERFSIYQCIPDNMLA